MLVSLLIAAQIMLIFMSIGSRHGFIRFAKESENRQELGSLLTTSNLLNIASGLLVTAISLAFLLPFFCKFLHVENVTSLVALTCALALFQSLSLNILSYYRVKDEGIKFVFSNISAMVAQMILTYFFLELLNLGVIGALLAQVITYFCLWLIVSSNIFAKTGLGISLDLAVKLLRYGAPLLFVLSGEYITDASAMYILSRYSGLQDVAIYALGTKLAGIVIIAIILPFQLAYEPFVYSNIDRSDIGLTISKLLTYLLFCFAFVAFGMAVISRPLLSVIAPSQYLPAYLVILLILPGLAFKGIYYIGESLIHITKRTYLTGSIVTFFTLISLALNLWLIPLFGRFGAIIVFDVTMAATALTLLFLGIRGFPIPLEKGRLTAIGALLAFFLILPYCFLDSHSAIFYGSAPIIASSSLAVIYFGHFLDDKEMIVIGKLIKKWGKS